MAVFMPIPRVRQTIAASAKLGFLNSARRARVFGGIIKGATGDRKYNKIRTVHLIQRLINSYWLLALCGVLDAIISVIYLIRQDTEGPLSFHAWHGTVVFLGKLTLAAGICTIAAGLWRSRKGKSWLLVLNGTACSTLGAIFAFWTGPLAFRTIALLLVVMAISMGLYELAIARALRRLADEWLLGAAGVTSVGFAFAFLAFVFRWIKLEPGSPAESLHWLGSYFGFSAICILVLSLRLHSATSARLPTRAVL
jgi:uncharacterized membrane protein HdeD (DUF308 family)